MFFFYESTERFHTELNRTVQKLVKIDVLFMVNVVLHEFSGLSFLTCI